MDQKRSIDSLLATDHYRVISQENHATFYKVVWKILIYLCALIFIVRVLKKKKKFTLLKEILNFYFYFCYFKKKIKQIGDSLNIVGHIISYQELILQVEIVLV